MTYDNSVNYEHIEIPELMHQQAMAYVDCAIELCKRMKNGELECTFLRGQATLYLGFHSTELFLKAAILHKTGKLESHHKLRELRKIYAEQFPDEKFKINTHYQCHYMGFSEGEIQEMIKQEKPADQKFRYPIDKNGKRWWKCEGFDAPKCLDQFREYREEMEKVGSEIYKETANQSAFR